MNGSLWRLPVWKKDRRHGLEVMADCRPDEYSQLAPYYDFLLGPFILPVRGEICRLASSRQFESVLDICCGTGEQCLMLSSLGFEVTGVDLSPGMIEVAKRNARGRVRFFREDAASLHFVDSSFDCAVISFALHEKEEDTRGRILREALRVVRKPGVLIIADFITPRGFLPKMAGGFVHVVERGAGRQHYRNFRDFMKRGALLGILPTYDLKLYRMKKLLFRNVAVVLAGT